MTVKTNRRNVLIGAAALGLTGTKPVDAAEDAPLLALGADLARLRRRCRRLGRQARRAKGDVVVWALWSRAVDETAAMRERIARTSAGGPVGLMVKMQAISWELLDDDLIVDEAARRGLTALNRELGGLVLT